MSDGDTAHQHVVPRHEDEPLLRPYFRIPKKEERRVALNFKVPETLKASLATLQRMWRLKAEAEGASEEEIKDIDLTFVCNELLSTGIDGAWEEVGAPAGLTGAPKTDSEWEAFADALKRRAARSQG